MKLLNWAETIEEPVPASKEDFLNRVEKTEIIYLVARSLWVIMVWIGVFLTILAPDGTKASWLGLSTIVIGSTGYLEKTIKADLNDHDQT